MEPRPHRILLIEDDPLAQLAFTRLAEGLPYNCRLAGSLAEARQRLAAERFDLVVTAELLGDGTGLEALAAALASGAALIMTAGQGDAATAVRAMQAGASDYLVKDADQRYLRLLPPAIERALRRQQTETALRESEEKFSKAFHASADGILIARSRDGQVIDVNDSFLRLSGYAREEVLGRTAPEIGVMSAGDHDRALAAMDATGHVPCIEMSLVTKSGQVRTVLSSIEPITIGGQPCSLSVTQDISARKQMEEALRTANAGLAHNLAELEQRTADLTSSAVLFRTLFNALPVGVLILDDAQLVVESNPALARILKVPLEKRASNPYANRSFIHPNGTPLRPEEFPTARMRLAGQPVSQVEMGIVNPAGETVWVEVSAASLPVPGLSAVVVSVDLTERRRIQAALQEAQDEFSKTFSASAAGIAITRLADGLILQVNDSYAQLIGYPRAELIGRKTLELGAVTPAERERLISRVREVGHVREMEISMRHSSGAMRTVLTTTEAITVGGEKCMLSILHDITERKQIEQALASERDQLQALLDNIPDTIYYKDRASRFTRINQAQARLLGIATPELAIGKTDADFQAPDLASQSYAEEQQLLASGQPVIDRVEFNPAPGGAPRWLSSTKVALKDTTGQVVGLVGISRDITGRIQSEHGLQRLNRQLGDRVRELSLLNNLSDQLQACLTFEETYPLTALLMSQLFPEQLGGLYVIDAARAQVTTGASWGAPAPAAQVFALDDCWALRRGQLHLADAMHAGEPCRHVGEPATAAWMCIPLMNLDQPLGVLHVRAPDAHGAQGFDLSTQHLARVVADNVALTWANLALRESLRQQAIRDPLTGLFNRRFMEESLARELNRALRGGQSVGMIMMDVDRFKQINDRLGHDGGDVVLRAVGRLLQSYCRPSDIACRFGGEEFLLILPEASLDITSRRAEQLRAAVQHMDFGVDGQHLGPISLSFGVAAYPRHGEDLESVVRAADSALYAAKNAGRDRVVVAGT